LQKNKIMACLALASVFSLQGCVVAPPPPRNGAPPPNGFQSVSDFAARVVTDMMVQLMYTPQPIDAVIVGVPPQNFVYVDGWTYIRHRDPHGRWVQERYRPGDMRGQLREHQAMLREVRARNGGRMPDRPMAFSMKQSAANKSPLKGLIMKKQPQQQSQQKPGSVQPQGAQQPPPHP